MNPFFPELTSEVRRAELAKRIRHCQYYADLTAPGKAGESAASHAEWLAMGADYKRELTALGEKS